MIRLTASFLACALIAMAPTASAHSPLKTSMPESGATLDASPEVITLTFGDEVLLTSVVKRVDGASTDLAYAPKAKAREFTVTAPDLATGENTLHWKALSPDGHVVEGDLTFTIATPSE